MREGRKWVHWLVAALFAGSLALTGCADDGDTGPQGPPGEPTLEAGNFVGVGNCAACHAGSTVAEKYAESAHANQGSHTISSCSQSCHNPLGEGDDVSAAFGVSTPNAVGCESCHGPGSGHYGVGPIPEAAPDTTVCGQCHDGTIADGTAHITNHPFNAEITSRFQTSRHASQHPREAFCSACHSHEGGVALLEMGGADNVIDLAEKFTSDTVESWSLTEEELSTKQCSTCHDPHTLDLRGEGDVEMTVTWDDDSDPTTPDVTETNVAYSAEFNLCTTCHMVDLEATPAGHGDTGLLFSYELSDASYTADNMVDAASGTYIWEEFEIENADGTTRTREVYATQVHYHDNGSNDAAEGEPYNDHNIGRKFVDTHFSGQAIGAVIGLDTDDPAVGPVNQTVPGYNVNAAAEDACTVCHDPHTGGKIISTAEGQSDDPTNIAVDYAEGVGDFHKDYLGDAMAHGCKPCHGGGEDFVAWTYGGSEPSERVTETIGCRTCHTLAVANAVPNENNAAAFDDVREFDAGHTFAFNSGVEVAASELGVNQICFECHKGRTPALTPAEEANVVNEYQDDLDGDGTDETYVGTENRTYSYLHYAPAFATLFGDESAMIPTYDGKTYVGRFVHLGGDRGLGSDEFGCVDCHNVHDTGELGSDKTDADEASPDEHNVVLNKMGTSSNCSGCHGPNGQLPAADLQARTEAYSVRLLESILPLYLAADGTPNLYPDLQAFITDLLAAPDQATQLDMLAAYLEGRTNVGPSPAAAKAGTIWKVFTYEDGSPAGPNAVHGHGGSWAHNSAFARQVMFDAIEAIGGDLTGLPAVPSRTVPAAQ